MKVAALIKRLQKCDPHAEVIMSSDMEGNSKGTFGEIYKAKGLRFARATEHNDECGIRKGDIQLCDDSDAEEDRFDGTPCIVLYPDM